MDTMDHSLLEQFMQLHGLLIRQFHQNRMAYGMMSTPYSGQGRVLKLLALKPELTQKELAELLGVRTQSLGELLAKLEKNGYVTRAPSEADRRVMLVRLTEKGRRATEDGVREEEESPFGCLSGEEQEQLNGYLSRMIASLEAQSASIRGNDRRRDFRGHRHGGFGEEHGF